MAHRNSRAQDCRKAQQKVCVARNFESSTYLGCRLRGHTLRRPKGQFTITDYCYACRIGYVKLPGVFGAVDCILSNSSLMPRLRMSRAVSLPCLYNFMARRAADVPFAIYHCLLSRRRRRLLLPNLFPSSERWNSVLAHHCL